ncbi:MAG TPA: serine protein kinase RIO [Nitrososphaerales archaeon]|nr:serine protein kinase RIO [Nitrososphaerales archaeon]
MKHLREIDEEHDYTKVHKEAERIDRRDRVILKNEEERSVFEEVFDRQTLMTLHKLSNKGAFSYLNGVISSGKESRVYWGVRGDGADLAVKIYLVASSDFKRRAQYVLGDPRFKKFKRDSRSVAELWARKEFTNLKQAHEAGASVPRPYQFLGNVLVSEFIGENGVAAGKLVDSQVMKKDYLEIIKQVKLLYSKARIVHGDLSEYNIFKFEGRIILFDFGSAVSILHPLALEYLSRDISNLNRFFERRGYATSDKGRIITSIVGKEATEDGS